MAASNGGKNNFTLCLPQRNRELCLWQNKKKKQKNIEKQKTKSKKKINKRPPNDQRALDTSLLGSEGVYLQDDAAAAAGDNRPVDRHCNSYRFINKPLIIERDDGEGSCNCCANNTRMYFSFFSATATAAASVAAVSAQLGVASHH